MKDIENPIIKYKHDSFQMNQYTVCDQFECLYCRTKFNSCEEGLLFDEDTYCNVECLIDDLTENGLLKEI